MSDVKAWRARWRALAATPAKVDAALKAAGGDLTRADEEMIALLNVRHRGGASGCRTRTRANLRVCVQAGARNDATCPVAAAGTAFEDEKKCVATRWWPRQCRRRARRGRSVLRAHALCVHPCRHTRLSGAAAGADEATRVPSDPSSDSECLFAPCAEPGCAARVCTDHGWAPCDSDEYDGGNACCMRCETYYCEQHEDRFYRCDVCHNASVGEVRLGCYDWASSAYLCNTHEPQYCGRKYFIGCGEAVRLEEIDLDGDEEDEDEDKDPEWEETWADDLDTRRRKRARVASENVFVCEFECCDECYDRHKCGDDPRDYC
jgi:hypothetical protein